MIDYRFQGRLTYIGGGLNVQMSAWPAAASANWWEPSGTFTCVAAYQAKGAASLAASYVNLANPGTYDVSVISAPSFNTATGWTFNGSSHRLHTGIALSATTTVIVRVANTASTSGPAIGAQSGDPARFRIYPRYANELYYSFSSTQDPANTAGAGVASGVIALTPTAIYVDGSSRESFTASAATLNIAIGFDGNQYYTGDILAVAIYSTSLDATQVGEITTAMAAL